MKYKKIENTSLHWVDLKYCSEKVAFQLFTFAVWKSSLQSKDRQWMEKKATPKQVEWRKRHISRRNKGNANQTRKETLLQSQSPKKHILQVFQKCMLLSIHPSWVHESHSVLFSSLHLYLQYREHISSTVHNSLPQRAYNLSS